MDKKMYEALYGAKPGVDKQVVLTLVLLGIPALAACAIMLINPAHVSTTAAIFSTLLATIL